MEVSFLRTENGIVPWPKVRKIRKLFCNHRNVIHGEKCSKSGLTRISGSDIYGVCKDCGHIVSEKHTKY